MPNWNDINRCPIWKVLGVTECENCDTHDDCWGDDSNFGKVLKGDKPIRENTTE